MSTIGSSTTLVDSNPHTILSSIAGFTQPTSKRINTLEDLLKHVQGLGLPKYDYTHLQWGPLLGQGASYRVFKCIDQRTDEAVAVKRIKLPPSSSKFEAFEYRVSCVLRDIEVMHHEPIRNHRNILRLLGYGWNYEHGDTIPFLVTEIASEGTLRQYLKRTDLRIASRFRLCGDVCAGLYELHLSGIAHGDIKLDNILVNNGGSEDPQAMLSDFGHSMLIASDQPSLNSYRGTKGYEPPEVYMPFNGSRIDIRKSDLWALGLACWEILAGGTPYYENKRIQAALAKSVQNDLDHAVAKSIPGDALLSNESIPPKLRSIMNQIADIAKQCIEEIIRGAISPHLIVWCTTFFTTLLAENADQRSTEVLHLPIFHANNLVKATLPRPQLIPSNAADRVWSFEASIGLSIFKPRSIARTPTSALAKIYQDFQFTIGHVDPIQSARSSLHLAFACANGFGVPGDLSVFCDMVKRCAPDVLPIASALTLLVTDPDWNLGSGIPGKPYRRFVVFVVRATTNMPRLPGIGPDPTYEELETAASNAAQALGSSAPPVSIFAVHHNMTHILPSGHHVDDADPMTGETALARACRIGNALASHELLNRGASASKPDNGGRLPLHWLFMFENDEMEPIATRLTSDWWIQHINTSANNAYVPDTQLPLVLHGTPLAFAVAACSVPATRLLLKLGADPLSGRDSPDLNWGSRSPLAIAVCLHLDHIFDILWKAITCDRRHAQSIDCAQLDVLACGMSQTAPVERYLVHGDNYKSAICRMAANLQETRASMFYKISFDKISFDCAISALEAAVDVMGIDWLLVDCLLVWYYRSSQEAKNWLLYFTIQVACRGTLTWTESVSILDYAFRRSTEINTLFPSHGRIIDIIVAQHQGRILTDWLLPKEPQVTDVTYLGRPLSPLYAMIENGLSKVVPCNHLLPRGADPNYVNPETGNSLLHIAVDLGTMDDVSALLNSGANPWRKNRRGKNPFFDAIRTQDVDLVSRFLPFKGDVNRVADGDSELPSYPLLVYSALALAASLPNPGIVAILLENGAACEAIRPNALHVAAANGNVEALKILVSAAPALLNSRGAEGNMPLHYAVQARRQNHDHAYVCAVMLLEAGADANAITQYTSIPAIHLVFRHFNGQQRLNLIRKFRVHGARLDMPLENGTTVLHLAAFMHDVPMVQYLLQEGISPSSRANHGQTPLHDCVRSYIDNKSNPTPDSLSDACCVIRMLVEAGATTPYRPNSKLHITAMENFNDSSSQIDNALPRSELLKNPKKITDSVKQAWKERQRKIVTERKKQQLEQENKIEGYGLMLFRDRNYKTSLELAVQRGSDQILLRCLLNLHEIGLRAPDSSSPEGFTDLHLLNRRHHKTVIQAGWAQAIKSKNWPAVKLLLRQEEGLDRSILNWTTCDQLLCYSIEHKDSELLDLFTGSGTSQMWTHVQSHVPYISIMNKLMLTNEFSVDLQYLWKITRKFVKLGDFTKQSDQGLRQPKKPITINSTSRAQRRWNMFWDLTKAMATQSQPANEESVAQVIKTSMPLVGAMQSMYDTDLQTLNLRCGSLDMSADNKRKSSLTNWIVSSQARKDKEKIEPFPGGNIKLVRQILRVIPATQTIALVGKTQFSCAPGRTATPLRLLIEVWFHEVRDAERLRKLAAIIHDYEVIYTTMQEVSKPVNRGKLIEFESPLDEDWFHEAMQCIEGHINWLRLSLEKESRKPSDDLRLPKAESTPQVLFDDDPIPLVSMDDMHEQPPSHVNSEDTESAPLQRFSGNKMESALPRTPSAPAPLDEDRVGRDEIYELEANNTVRPCD